MLVIISTIAAFLLGWLAAVPRADGTKRPSSDKGEVAMVRSYFMIGGSYDEDVAGGRILRDQMYVEHMKPPHGVHQPYPIVMIHGGSQTGSNFLNKPDGGRGWASLFIEQGYELFIVDIPARGRSAWLLNGGPDLASAFPVKYVESHFTAPKKYGLWPQASKHSQWNGSGQMGDPVFDQFYASNVQSTTNASWAQAATQRAGAVLLDRINKPVILMGHSQGGPMVPAVADARPNQTKALILLEPAGPPFREAVFKNTSARAWGVTDIPLRYDPLVLDPATDLVVQQTVVAATDTGHTACILQADSPTPRRLTNLADKPILLVTAEASYHAVYDHCTVQYLRQAGCSRLQHMELAELGIHGNGHMMFMEKNSDEIQAVLHDWIVTML